MLISMQLGNGCGAPTLAWRAPQTDPRNCANADAYVRYAHAAERGKFQFLFLPDFLSQSQPSDQHSPMLTMDPFITMAVMARETRKIGFVSTAPTTFHEPYNLARKASRRFVALMANTRNVPPLDEVTILNQRSGTRDGDAPRA